MSGVLGGGFADHGSCKVEELPVDGFEEGEERETVLELRVDGVFEHGEEFGEGSLEGLAGSLGRREPEDGGCEIADSSRCS